ncbi:MAG: riboflavin biosynthesis protein RibF [Porphyromonas sp.]|nr:riboflavin biosynthesis protein RibF [Porphyromonas sp.]
MTKVLHSIDELKSELGSNEQLVVSVGFFDGVHKGHQSLIKTLLQEAEKGNKRSVIITMDEHPSRVLGGDGGQVPLLTSQAERLRLLRAAGADFLLVLTFDRALSEMSAEQFLQPLIELGLNELVLGYDNRFGHNSQRLSQEEFDTQIRAMGLTLRRVKPFVIDGEVTVSSSAIRTALAAGDFLAVERLLGRPYSLEGEVAKGRQIGRSIGYPTANLFLDDAEVLLPKTGVYIAEVMYGGEQYKAMGYLGSSPTVTGSMQGEQRFEAFLLDFKGDIYGEEIEVYLRLYLRGDIRFGTLEELKQQLTQDEVRTRNFFKQQGLSDTNRTKLWN